MPLYEVKVPAEVREVELYYLHVPCKRYPVAHAIEFLEISRILEDEAACKSLWEMITTGFKTRSKFLTIWPHVRFVALHRVDGELLGALLVSTPLNWQIDYVIVRSDKRSQGIASSLVNETVNQAAARRVPYIMLTSRKSLRPLYEGTCGFTVVGGNAPNPSGLPSDTPYSHSVPSAIQ